MPNGDQMKAIRLHEFGDPQKLVYEDAPIPRPRDGQVLVKIEAAGINFADIERRRGGVYSIPTPMPYVLGGEFVGTVVELGPGIEAPALGSRVFGLVNPATSGCYAQYVAVPARVAYPLPPNIDDGAGLALLVQGLMAYFLLEDGVGLSQTDRLMVMAAAGGVGSIAVQLARHHFKCRTVVALAGTEMKRAAALDLGANVALGYAEDGWVDAVKAATEGKGVDAALLMTGGRSFVQALSCLAPFGRARVYGTANGEVPVLDYGDPDTKAALAANQSVGFFFLRHYQAHAPERVRAVLQILQNLVQDKVLRIEARGLPLSQAPLAHELVEKRQSVGKVYLQPWVTS